MYAAKIVKLRFQAPHQLAFLGDPIVLFKTVRICMRCLPSSAGGTRLINALSRRRLRVRILLIRRCRPQCCSARKRTRLDDLPRPLGDGSRRDRGGDARRRARLRDGYR